MIDISPEEDLMRRTYEAIDSEFKRTYWFVEPTQENAETYSLAFRNLHQSICQQIESFFKYLLKKHNMWPQDKDDVSFDDYFPLLGVLGLRDMIVETKSWTLLDSEFVLKPFEHWTQSKAPEWWSDHNKVKHNFAEHFPKANLRVTMESLGALYILLSHPNVSMAPSPESNVFAHLVLL